MRKCFLDNLPKKKGSGKNKGKMVVDWKKSIGCNIPFIYDNLEGDLYINGVDIITKKINIIYKNQDFEISSSQITSCKIGRIIGKFTKDFKIDEDLIISEKRNITIIDRRRNEMNHKKYYKYHCNNCGNEDWIEESVLIKGNGCCVCSSKKIKLGINTIWDTDRWMCDLGVSEEDAKRYSHSSVKKITINCPNCGREKQITPNKIYNRKSIQCSCGDGVSYPEKFIISLLDQLYEYYKKEYSPNWANNKRYDFYIPKYNIIIECHGDQHYNKSHTFVNCGGNDIDVEQENDAYKKQLALDNNINEYIILDCRKSELDWIRNSIMNSQLSKIFNLNNIDWIKCEKFALGNRVKEVCNYWNQKEEWETIADLANKFNLSKKTIREYLKRGNVLGWCKYNIKRES